MRKPSARLFPVFLRALFHDWIDLRGSYGVAAATVGFQRGELKATFPGHMGGGMEAKLQLSSAVRSCCSCEGGPHMRPADVVRERCQVQLYSRARCRWRLGWGAGIAVI